MRPFALRLPTEASRQSDMKKFTYEIEIYPAEHFSDIVYYCTDDGECKGNPPASSQIERLKRVLNEKGAEGWELVHVSVGGSGLFAVWKMEATERE